ncbi:MAG: glycosyltransferase family 2 protein [Desulfobacterales bacterium]|nr:glycosyltransferase family 2 protein [Desulfobacterales bacterium]
MKKHKNVDISLIIPAYNEESNIRPLVSLINDFRKNSENTIEAIIVNDGSSDGTDREIQNCSKEYDFIVHKKHKTNIGMTEGILTGLKASTGKYLVIFPADLQYKPDCIKDLVSPLEQGYDMVTGFKEGNYDKKVVSFFYNKLSRWIFKKVNVKDLNSVKAMKREVLEGLNLRKDWHRYIAVLASEKGYKITETKVTLYPRHSGESKFSGKSRILVGIFDMLSVKFLLSFSQKPLLLFGTLGLSLILLGILTGVCAIIARVFFQAGFRPLLYLVMLLIMIGVNFFALGFIAELIVMLRERIEKLEKKINSGDNEE